MRDKILQRRDPRKFGLLAASLLGSLAPVASAFADPPSVDDHRSAAELETRPASLPNGFVVQDIWAGTGFRVASIQRNAPGEVEVHASMSDVFVIEKGRATALLGGRVEGGRETAPGERRGGTIVGGHLRELAPGDMLWVPAGLPHQIIPKKGGIFRYAIVKVEARAQAAAGSFPP